MFEVESIYEDSESTSVEAATATPARRHFIDAPPPWGLEVNCRGDGACVLNRDRGRVA
jgi:hypothetical protein